MADRNKFEEMLERLVSEDRAGAEELFHEIVVEKSRNIYESLLEDDLGEADMDLSDKSEELSKWLAKYDNYQGFNGDELPMGWIKSKTSTGVMPDGWEENEWEAYQEKLGKDITDMDNAEIDAFLDDPKNSPITSAMFDELLKITGASTADEDLARAVSSALGISESIQEGAGSLDSETVEAILKLKEVMMDKGMEPEEAQDEAAEAFGVDPEKLADHLDSQYDEGFDLEEFEVEGDEDDMDMGGDPADDMMGDIEADMGDDDDKMSDDDEEEIEDRVVDLEDALDDLKAEFEKMMADDGDDDMDMGEPEEEEDENKEEESFEFEAEEKDDDEEEPEEKDEVQQMREYVEKIGAYEDAKGGDEGKGVAGNNHGTSISNTNTKSAVAPKNDMGGDAGNLVQGGEEKGRAAPDAKDMNSGNVNTSGSRTATKMSQTKGHGAEKKGAGETADNKKSGLGS